jgi:hypothetical protein
LIGILSTSHYPEWNGIVHAIGVIVNMPSRCTRPAEVSYWQILWLKHEAAFPFDA